PPAKPAMTTPPPPPPARCDGVQAQVGAEKRCLKPKDSFKDCDACPEMVVIPSGKFLMGSDGEVSEGPQHIVTIDKALAIGRFPVTSREFAAFVRETNYRLVEKCWTYDSKKWEERTGLSFRNPGFSQDDRHPVVCVNWHDARAFANWLSEKTAKSYRLPSEAEREYVTRAGTTTPFWWGSSIVPTQANYTSAGASKEKYQHGTVPVDSFLPNPWGLYNVHGNAWELTEDCWNASYAGAPTGGSVWTSGDCDKRVVRGGDGGGEGG